MSNSTSQDDKQPLIQKSLVEAKAELNDEEDAQINVNAVDQSSNFLLDSISSIQQMFDSITDSLSKLQSDFENKIKYDESKERTIDALHRELQDYREDLNFKILRPPVMDLVGLHDDLNMLAIRYRTHDEPSSGKSVAADFENFATEIEEIVSRYGFEFYQAEGDVFDRTLQRTQKVENTEKSELNKQIIERTRKGLRYGERVVRPEVVTAYRYVTLDHSNVLSSTP
jgi:molecular chaperone GrpE